MSLTTKTTVYLNTVEYRRLKAIARSERRTAAALIREAITRYVNAQAGRVRPASVGAARSRRGDLSERTDELLEGLGST